MIEPIRDDGPPPPSFEKISHLGELLIVIFYAEAYQEAATNFVGTYKESGFNVGSVLLFVIFFTVTVRFFVGNHLHLSDERWNTKLAENHDGRARWNTERWRRNLYYIDVLFIVLESLAMIVLGALATIKASLRLLVGMLILISALDVVWICCQRLLDWVLARQRSAPPQGYRPKTKLHKWLYLNMGVIVALGVLLLGPWNEPISTTMLLVVTAINVAAFVIDIFVCNLFAT